MRLRYVIRFPKHQGTILNTVHGFQSSRGFDICHIAELESRSCSKIVPAFFEVILAAVLLNISLKFPIYNTAVRSLKLLCPCVQAALWCASLLWENAVFWAGLLSVLACGGRSSHAGVCTGKLGGVRGRT